MKATQAHIIRFRANLKQFLKLKEAGTLNGQASFVETRLEDAATSIGLDFKKELKAVKRESSCVKRENLAVRKNPSLPTIQIDTSLLKGDTIKELRESAKKYAKNNYIPSTITNKDQDLDVMLRWQGVKRTIYKRAPKIRLYTVPYIPELIEKGLLTTVETDRKDRKDIKRVLKFEVLARINDKLYSIWIVVRETASGRLYYQHTIVEKNNTKKRPAGITGGTSQKGKLPGQASTSQTEDTKNSDKRENPCTCKNFRPNPSAGPACVVTATAKTNEKKGGIEIRFSAEPPQEILDTLSDAGYLYWTPEGEPSFWSAKISKKTKETAESIAGTFDSAVVNFKPKSNNIKTRVRKELEQLKAQRDAQKQKILIEFKKNDIDITGTNEGYIEAAREGINFVNERGAHIGYKQAYKQWEDKHNVVKPIRPIVKELSNYYSYKERRRETAKEAVIIEYPKFEVGKQYTAKYPGDSELDPAWLVLKRTPKTVTIKSRNEVVTRKIHNSIDGEYCFPDGRYSMAAVLRANRLVENESANAKPEKQKPNPVIIKGSKTTIDFKADGSIEQSGHYAIMEAAALEASHNKDCSANSKHLISRAQPRDRSKEALCAQPKFIAQNLNPASITLGNLAFVGAPVVTFIDGSILAIQGNGRSIALKIAYDEYPTSAKKYENYLIENDDHFGISAELIKGFEQPILVRLVDVSKERAIKLGNVVDTSQAKMSKIDQAKAYIRNLIKGQISIIGKLIQNSEGETIGAIIDDVGMDIIGQLKELDRTGIIAKNQLTQEGKDFLRSVLVGLVFDSEKAPNVLRNYMNLPHRIKAGIERSFGYIIPLIGGPGDIRETLYGAVEIAAKVSKSNSINTAKEFANTDDMFENKSFSKPQIAIAQFLLDASTQKEIRDAFKYYTELITVNNTLFGESKPKNRKEALNMVFVEKSRPNPQNGLKDVIHDTIVRAQRLQTLGNNNRKELAKLESLLGPGGYKWNAQNTQIIITKAGKDHRAKLLANPASIKTVKPKLKLRVNGNANLVYLGVAEQVDIASPGGPKGIKGRFIMCSDLAKDTLYIIPQSMVKGVKNKVDSDKAEALFEQFHNYDADGNDFEITWPANTDAVPVGTAEQIFYASDKIIQPGDKKGKANRYRHEFDPGKRPVKVLGNMLVIDNIKWNERGLLN